ncbi:SPOR domain-containing protein [Candidatus Venteria ishoeyi]|uniref:Sporulation related domain protein n=1 Tax=Candidatus Venteria ishoeyi TaxID=1899563 RepID=A0A1H6FEK0_9GAMM|nr:SPOR domain-containing protein [Candidatus Venteria ishoeyi]MDM8546441.1 SPOR domain-containing protein [Candidatus Venteria ishoeyi]SEH08492.1 Sporulation related domain protein [Candidatus Venteria ishoeyi]
MAKHNTRIPQPVEEPPYDPKQRITGGMVLFVLMLLIYVIIKSLLGISSTGAEYALREPLPDEMGTIRGMQADLETQPSPYPIINNFVFLDLQGQPIDEEGGNSFGDFSEAMPETTDFDGSDGKEWYVQAASFRDKNKARNLVKKLKTKELPAVVVKTTGKKGIWYVVRLLPQETKSQAKQQLRRLKQQARLKGMIKKIP